MFLNEENQVKKTRKTADKKGGEDKIKRAPSPFNLYFQAVFPEVKAKSTQAKAPELLATVSSMWKELPPSERAPYEMRSEQLKSEVRAKREVAKAEAKKNARPAAPYSAFVKDHFHEIQQNYPGLSFREISSKVSAAWKEVPEADKKAMSEQYKQQLEQWRAKHQVSA